MADTFHLEIVSPERVFFSGATLELVFPSIDGSRGVMAHHEPMVTALAEGELRYRTEDGQWHYAAISNGYAEVMPDYVILLAATVERPEEIDRKRAEQAKACAEERLRQRQSQIEYHQAQAALSRAMARLKATSHRR